MYRTSIFSQIVRQILNIGRGTRIAAGMLTASLRAVYAFCLLICLNAIFFLYYFDVIIRTLFAGGSSIAWAIITAFKRRGITLPMHVFGVEWALHLPEQCAFYGLFALFSLMMMHVVNNAIDGGSCGIGRALFRALRAWRFIIIYALFMSCLVWMVGDLSLNCTRWILMKIEETPVLIESLYEPIYGKKVVQFLMISPYWLSQSIRLSIAGIWYLITFLLFPIVAAEQCSFFVGVRRSCSLMLHNIGLVLSAALFYSCIYVGGMVATLYGQLATFPSLENVGMKSSVQVIVLFAFMTLILFTVHAALVSSGNLIASVYLYRICTKQRIPVNTFSIEHPYWSSFLYLMFFVFYWIIIRCGIHVQMPTL